MKKYLIIILASFFVGGTVYAFKPATLFIETWEGIKRVAVYSRDEASELFGQGYKLETEQNLGGTSITTINGSDTISASRTTINDNFASLNLNKIEISTTTLPFITTLENLATIGTITTGTWNAGVIAGTYGGTGTSSPTRYQVILGDGADGLTVASGTGTSGQFFTSNGAGAYPSWTTSAVDTALDYTWTGQHNFATTTAATSTIEELTIGSSTPTIVDQGKYTNLTSGNNADSLHTHSSSKLQVSTSTNYTAGISEVPLIASTTIAANALGTNGVIRAKVNISTVGTFDNGATRTFKVRYGSSGGISVIITNSSGGSISINGYVLAEVIAANSTSAQEVFISAHFGNGTITDAAVDSLNVSYSENDSITIDSTQDQPFVILGKSSDANSITAVNGYVEILKN